MDAELKAKWVSALRSGGYQQGKSSLKDADQYCCLGVLAVVKGCSWKDGEDYGEVPTFDDREVGLEGDETSYLDEDFCGLHFDDEQRELANMNDKGKSFAEIADWIEAKL